VAITIAIADPHPVLRAGIRSFFGSQAGIHVAGECEDLGELNNVLQSTPTDMVVLDAAIVGEPFEEWIAEFSGANAATRLIVLGSSRDEGQIRSMFHAGLAGYVLKDATAGELTNAILRVAGGERYLSSTLHFDIETPNSGRGRPKDILSEREYEVFRQLGSGIRPRDIAKSLDLSAKTVDTYRANILRKLNLENIAALIRLAAQSIND
jgi:two-component system invasion response regulator UvrY